MRNAPSPRTAINALAVGHTLWGLVAYGDQVAGIARSLPGSVGDGIFDRRHSRDARAAGFWFLFVGPLLALLGRLYESAEAADDRPAMRTSGRAILAISAAGWTVVPASGFPAGVGLGVWLMRRSRKAGARPSNRDATAGFRVERV
jgi:Family of unknown function (DUF6463)